MKCVKTAVCLLRLVFTLAAKTPLQTRLTASRISKTLQAAQSPWRSWRKACNRIRSARDELASTLFLVGLYYQLVIILLPLFLLSIHLVMTLLYAVYAVAP